MKRILIIVVVVIVVLQVIVQEGRFESVVLRERGNMIFIGLVVGFGYFYIQNVGLDVLFKLFWNVGVIVNLSIMEYVGWLMDVLYFQEGGMYNNVLN